MRRVGAFGRFAAMYSPVSFNRCNVQLEGRMVRCPIELLQMEFKNSEHVRNLFVSYSVTLELIGAKSAGGQSQRRELARGTSGLAGARKADI
jgi:hypothetical protein